MLSDLCDPGLSVVLRRAACRTEIRTCSGEDKGSVTVHFKKAQSTSLGISLRLTLCTGQEASMRIITGGYRGCPLSFLGVGFLSLPIPLPPSLLFSLSVSLSHSLLSHLSFFFLVSFLRSLSFSLTACVSLSV